MAKYIEAKALPRYLWHEAPLIYFYDGKCDDKNTELVLYMNQMAKRYNKLKVLCIDWEDKKRFYPATLPDELNKIYLCSCGYKVNAILYKDKEDINKIFIKAIDQFNEYIEKRAEKIGSRPSKQCEKIQIQKSLKEKRKCHLREFNIKHKKKYALKNKIKIKDDIYVEQNQSKNYFKAKMKLKNMLVDKNLRNNVKNLPIPHFNYETNNLLDSNSNNWFNDVDINELPTDIISNQYPNELENKNISKIPNTQIRKYKSDSSLLIKSNHDLKYRLLSQKLRKTKSLSILTKNVKKIFK